MRKYGFFKKKYTSLIVVVGSLLFFNISAAIVLIITAIVFITYSIIIQNKSKNLVSYFIKDVLIAKIKMKNNGKDTVKLYEEEIKFFKPKLY